MQLGRYEVVRKLGEGGMARVLLAKSATGAHVVLKVPFTQAADFAERVRDEARVGLRVHHPSVVDTLDLFEHEGRPILVVEYVEGASLQQLRRQGGAMPPGLVARIGRQVAEGLAFLHEATDENDQPLNILHRDVAPGNILVTPAGDAKLIDLGIARGVETKAKKTQVGTVRGTMRYLAPELLAGEPHTPATDLWALGVVLFEAALGRRAAEGDEREVLATIVRGDIAKLRDGEVLDETLRDGLHALLAPRDSRLQRARAAANVLKRLEGALPPDDEWCPRVVGEVLTRTRERWAAEAAALANAPTVARPPSDDDDDDDATAATMPSLVGSGPPEGVAPVPPDDKSAPTGITDPRPRVAPEEELGHPDGVAPTVRMSAVELDALAPGAPTEQMPAVNPVAAPLADTRVSGAPFGVDQTQKFPKPGPADSPLAPDQSSSLAWRNVAAPTILGLTAADVAPSTGGPAHPAPHPGDESRSEPIIAAEPDEKTEAGAPPPRPPSGWGAASSTSGAPVGPPPSAPATRKPAEISGPLPRMLRVHDALPHDTELAQPAVHLPTQAGPVEGPVEAGEPASLPEAHATPRSPLTEPPGAPRKPLDPSHRPPDPSALGIPTPPPLEAARALTAAPAGVRVPEESTETAFPVGVPSSLPPSDALAPGHSRPPPARPSPAFENTDRTMRMPPAPRAGFVGQRANPDDATERVERWGKHQKLDEAAAGFEEPLLSGELAWRPNRTKHIAIAAAVAVAVAVATVVVLFLVG